MPATVNGGGDQLARGAVRVNFRASDTVSQDKWNDIFGDDSGPKPNIMPESEREREEKPKKKSSRK